MGFEPFLPTLARLKRGGLRNNSFPLSPWASPAQTRSERDGIACEKL
jgi:hypothetical protein